MDDEVGIKVTRLRRRISVDQVEDGKSSPAPGTPTKKRGGKKVAKSELDLIDENVVENNLKKTTKKTIVKEVADGNVEDKPVTPSRRSARIKSNTSIVSDTVQNNDTPRAKRAARRTSQVGSDTETPLTPARQTRRTRKDSTSSIEKQVDAPLTTIKTTQIPDVISEEPENVNKTGSNESKNSDNENSKQSPIRKSPRLLNKKSNNESLPDDEKIITLKNIDTGNISQSSKISIEEYGGSPTKTTDNEINKEVNKNNSEQNRLSVSSSNLIMDLDTKPKKTFLNINKSCSEALELNKIKSKRQRTKSWTTISTTSFTSDNFYSDNEKTKKKHKDNTDLILKQKTFDSGSGDSKLNDSKCADLNNEELNDSQRSSISTTNSSARKKNKDADETSKNHTLNELDSNNEAESTIQMDEEIANLFKKDPSRDIKTIVIMEDSDSNSIQINTNNTSKNEDQCVPVVDHQLEDKGDDSPEYKLSTSFENKKNDSIKCKIVFENESCEPMDVDETLPETLPNNTPKELEIHEELLNNSQESNSKCNFSKANRKSSITLSTSHNFEKSYNENKSTLILSQLKDISDSDNKSPQVSNNKQLSKSIDHLNVTQDNSKVNKKLSMNYLTSTPLQQKTDSDKHSDKNSKNIFSNDISKDKKITPKKDTSAITNQSEHSSKAGSCSEEESLTDEDNNLLDDEAEEARESYESGDSQDEDEKQYENDNEIVEKGETLTSEDEFSNDSDYEKDSFLVTSDEEDNELLSGSGDDLSMSDNELKMTSKSKKKYNDRKLKEQKQASREMFESRHKLNVSKNSKVKQNSSQRLQSSESEEDVIGLKKNKRIRINSTNNESITNSDSINSDSHKHNKNKDLAEASYKDTLIDNEINMYQEVTDQVSNALTMQLQSPETTVKEANVSVGFVGTEIIKDTSYRKNASNTKSQDNLEDSDDDDSSLSSEDKNIAHNYDNMLSKLKTKTANHSLNFDERNKTMSKSNIPIIDDLNLTRTKGSIKLKTNSSQDILNSTEVKSNEMSLKVNKSNLNISGHTENDVAPNIHKMEISKLSDLSLNLDKKSKKTGNQPIIDQLNLTEIKDKSRNKNIIDSKNIENLKNIDDSSDSIDLNLLFSEDSIHSEDSNKESKRNTGDNSEKFIPLRKTKAKTDIRVNNDVANNEKDEDMSFFVDTIGNLSEEDEKITSLTNDAASTNDSNDDEAPPLEVSYKKEKSIIKEDHHNISETDNKPELLNDNSMLKKTPQSAKKKKTRNSMSQNVLQMEPESTYDKSESKTPMAENKKKKRASESFNVSNLEFIFSLDNEHQTPSNEENKIKKLSESIVSEHQYIDADEANDKSVTKKTSNSEKKKKKNLSESLNKSKLENSLQTNTDEEILDESINKEKHGKKKKNLSESLNKSKLENSLQTNTDEGVLDESINKEKHGKKKKNLSESLNKSKLENSLQTNTDEGVLDESINKQKNGKKKNNLSQSEIHLQPEDESETNKSVENQSMKDKLLTNKGANENKNNTSDSHSKRRKRKFSTNPSFEISVEDESSNTTMIAANESISSQKKRKLIQNSEETVLVTKDIEEPVLNETTVNTSVTINENVNSSQVINQSQNTKPKSSLTETISKEIEFEKTKNKGEECGSEKIKKKETKHTSNTESENARAKPNKIKKRKNREDDYDANKALKVLKENSFDQIHIPRLPSSLLNKLDDKPKEEKVSVKKHRIISTTEFVVEETKTRRNKPSNYLEQSIYLNDDDNYLKVSKQKGNTKNPKVLPFIPTAAISNSGYTTNFKVNVIPQEIKFVAQSNNVASFKNDYLYSKKIKRFGTYELYKKNRNIKMSKF